MQVKQGINKAVHNANMKTLKLFSIFKKLIICFSSKLYFWYTLFLQQTCKKIFNTMVFLYNSLDQRFSTCEYWKTFDRLPILSRSYQLINSIYYRSFTNAPHPQTCLLYHTSIKVFISTTLFSLPTLLLKHFPFLTMFRSICL